MPMAVSVGSQLSRSKCYVAAWKKLELEDDRSALSDALAIEVALKAGDMHFLNRAASLVSALFEESELVQDELNHLQKTEAVDVRKVVESLYNQFFISNGSVVVTYTRIDGGAIHLGDLRRLAPTEYLDSASARPEKGNSGPLVLGAAHWQEQLVSQLASHYTASEVCEDVIIYTVCDEQNEGILVRNILSGEKFVLVGNDTMAGGAGIDTVTYSVALGSLTIDLLAGTASPMGDDVIDGDAGDDKLMGEAGADTIGGGAGNDTIQGGADADHLYGADGNDLVPGDGGNDTLLGGDGDDSLYSRFVELFTLEVDRSCIIVEAAINQQPALGGESGGLVCVYSVGVGLAGYEPYAWRPPSGVGNVELNVTHSSLRAAPIGMPVIDTGVSTDPEAVFTDWGGNSLTSVLGRTGSKCYGTSTFNQCDGALSRSLILCPINV